MVFLVFFSHLTELPIDKDILFVFGRIGVAGFFLMSGFLAVRSVESRSLKQFAFNRFMRLYPIFWILVTITFLLNWPKIPITDWVANLTLFHQFLGVDSILGASWMLPIMVVFFGLLMVCKKNTERYINYAFYAMCLGSLVLGALRFYTGKPFPTAFCLLQLVGLLGWMYKKENVLKGKVLNHLLMFEVVLVVAAYLSYDMAVARYFIAYNLGMMTFWAFKKWNVQVKAFDKLGELGFTFFLGAGIPMLVLKKFVDLSTMNVYAEVGLKFVLAICLAWVVTKFVEKPLLAKGKEWEKKMK